MLNIVYKYKNGQTNIYNYKNKKNHNLMKEINKINKIQNYKPNKIIISDAFLVEEQ